MITRFNEFSEWLATADSNQQNDLAHETSLIRRSNPYDQEWYFLTRYLFLHPTKEMYDFWLRSDEDGKVGIMRTMIRDIMAAGWEVGERTICGRCLIKPKAEESLFFEIARDEGLSSGVENKPLTRMWRRAVSLTAIQLM